MPLAFEDGEVPQEWRIANPLGSYNDWVDSLGLRLGFARGKPRAGSKAIAYVNHGRWVADCPLGDGGARGLKPGLDFFCIECGNTFAVEWPDAMSDIADALELRSDRTTQNFHPEESTDPGSHLLAENIEHGIGAD